MNKADEVNIADKIEILKNDRSFTQTIRDGIRLICDLRDGKLNVLFELFPWVRAEFMEYMRDIQPVVVTPVEQGEVTPQLPQPVDAQQAWLEAEQDRIEAERIWHEKRMRDAEQALEAERQKIEAERSQTQSQIQQQLERLEQLLLQQGNQPITGGLQPVSGSGGKPATASSGPKSLSVPQFSTPTFDDDDDDDDIDLVVKKNANSGIQAAQNFIKSIQQLQQ